MNINGNWFYKKNMELNLLYPLGWVIFFQLVMVLLVLFDGIADYFFNLYQSLMWFSSLNKSHPFSTHLGQAYAMILVFFIPIQIASLFCIKHTDILNGVFIGSNKAGAAAPIFTGISFVVLFVFLPLSDNSLVRLLGNGTIAISIITPLVTSLLALALRLALCNVSDKSI